MDQTELDLLARLPELPDEEKHQRIAAGLSDVQAGKTIAHAQLMAVVQSGLKPITR